MTLTFPARFPPLPQVGLLAALLLASCAVGPDYTKPSPRVSAHWDGGNAFPEDTLADPRWWRRFEDPLLESLIDRALAGNFDLRTAEARISEARGRTRSATGALFPQIGLTAAARRNSGGGRTVNVVGSGTAVGGLPIATAAGGSSRSSTLYQAGFDASWEIDLFGGLRRTREAALAEEEALARDLDAAKLSLLAEIVRNYLTFRLYQTQFDLAAANGQSQRETARITQARVAQGVESGLELSRARAILGTTEAQLPLYDNLAGTARMNLELLLGETPGALSGQLAPRRALPLVGDAVALETPLAVVSRRPDVAAAERRLALATANRGVAEAGLYPTLTLSGLIGFAGSNLGRLFDSTNENRTIGGNLGLPILDFGRLRGQVDIADAQAEQALVAWQATVVAALHEVETTLLAYRREVDRRAILADTTEANREAVRIAKLQYAEGILSQLDVLDAERSLYTSESTLAQSTADAAANYVALNKALGWGIGTEEGEESGLPARKPTPEHEKAGASGDAPASEKKD